MKSNIKTVMKTNLSYNKLVKFRLGQYDTQSSRSSVWQHSATA